MIIWTRGLGLISLVLVVPQLSSFLLSTIIEFGLFLACWWPLSLLGTLLLHHYFMDRYLINPMVIFNNLLQLCIYTCAKKKILITRIYNKIKHIINYVFASTPICCIHRGWATLVITSSVTLNQILYLLSRELWHVNTKFEDSSLSKPVIITVCGGWIYI